MRKTITTLAALAASFALAISASAQEKKLPDGCKLVTVTRADVSPAKSDIPFTFRGEGSNVAAIQSCNPKGQTGVIGVNASLTDGARVIVRTKSGRATIGLPTVYASGDVHNVSCVVKDGAMQFKLYQLAWQNGLPAELNVPDASDKIVGDAATHVAGCMAAATPDILAQLKK